MLIKQKTQTFYYCKKICLHKVCIFSTFFITIILSIKLFVNRIIYIIVYFFVLLYSFSISLQLEMLEKNHEKIFILLIDKRYLQQFYCVN